MTILSVNETATTRPNGSWLPLLVLAGLIALCGYWGYQQLFSTFASYDDEGYVMLSLQSFMQGHALYDDTYSQYGPAFFQVQFYLHDLLELEITHDAVRFKALAFWLLISLLSAATIWLLTKRAWFAVIVFGGVFAHLDRLCLEPGHPQELGALCLVGTTFVASFLGTLKSDGLSQRRVEFGVIGGLVAVALLTKINLGVVLGLPVGLALFVCCRDDRGAKLLLAMFGLASLALLVLITRQTGFQPASSALPLVVGIGLTAAMLVGIRQAKRSEVNFKHVSSVLIGFLVVTVWVTLIAILKRTTISGLVDGIVLQHLGFGNFFFSPAPLHPATLGGALVGLILAAATSFKVSGAATLGRILLSLLVFAASVVALTQSFSVPSVGFDDRGMAGLLVSFATSLCWVILIPIGQVDDARFSRFGRITLCLTAIFQPLIAYPTPGTQMAVGSFLFLSVGVVALSDLIDQSASMDRDATTRNLKWMGSVLCVCVLATSFCRCIDLGVKRAKMAWLDLPGATRLRLPEKKVNAIRAVVDRLSQDSDTFVFAENTRNSFYFWTEKKPPTAINATAWPYMLKSDQQQRIIDALQQFERVLIVRDQAEWPLPKDAPLVNWINSNFEFESIEGPFEIWQPNAGQP